MDGVRGTRDPNIHAWMYGKVLLIPLINKILIPAVINDIEFLDSDFIKFNYTN